MSKVSFGMKLTNKIIKESLVVVMEKSNREIVYFLLTDHANSIEFLRRSADDYPTGYKFISIKLSENNNSG